MPPENPLMEMSQPGTEKIRKPAQPVVRALTNPPLIVGVPQELFLLNLSLLPFNSILFYLLGISMALTAVIGILAHGVLAWLADRDPHAGTLTFCLLRQARTLPDGIKVSRKEQKKLGRKIRYRLPA